MYNLLTEEDRIQVALGILNLYEVTARKKHVIYKWNLWRKVKTAAVNEMDAAVSVLVSFRGNYLANKLYSEHRFSVLNINKFNKNMDSIPIIMRGSDVYRHMMNDNLDG